MLPAFLRIKSSPGSAWVSNVGSTRESEQVINSARGDCLLERLLNSALLFSNTPLRNFKMPLTSFSLIVCPTQLNWTHTRFPGRQLWKYLILFHWPSLSTAWIHEPSTPNCTRYSDYLKAKCRPANWLDECRFILKLNIDIVAP
jgi:hypothetical protein